MSVPVFVILVTYM